MDLRNDWLDTEIGTLALALPPQEGFAHTPPLCRFDCLDDTQEAERLEVSWQRLVGVEGEMPGWRPIEHKMGKITKV
jgi:hypothetical protein